MAQLIYKRLFNIIFRHNYYVSGLSFDFKIVPTSQTQQILKDNNLLFKFDETGFRILYRGVDVPSANSFINFANLELRFALTLKNAVEFLNITNLSNGAEPFRTGNLLFFSNNVVTTAKLNYSILDELKPAQFTYEFPQTAAAPTDLGSIEIFNEAGTNVTPTPPPPSTGIKPGSNNKFTYMVDLSNLPVGIYTFKTKINGGSEQIRDFYIDNELFAQNIVGLIRIKAVNALAASYPPVVGADPARQYFAEFVRRTTKWRYVVIPKFTTVPIADLTVQDNQLAPIPAPYASYSFTPLSNVVVNGITCRVFESTVAIPFFETPKKVINVRKTTGPPANQILLPNIDNPSRLVVTAPTTDINVSIIYVIV